jgi:hypothetical protein
MAFKIKSLPKTTSILKNENGAVIVASLMILVLLTIIGIASINVSNTEVQISGHEVAHKVCFYQAEGATMQAIDGLEAIPDPLATPPSWLETTLDTVSEGDAHIWDFPGAAGPESSAMSNSEFVAISEGILPGSSLNLGSAKVHSYTIYGRCAIPRKGATSIQVGYLRAF